MNARHKGWAVLVAIVVVIGVSNLATGEDEPEDPTSAGTSQDRQDRRPKGQNASDNRRDKQPESEPQTAPTRRPSGRVFLVTRIVDGDTVELGNGETVRLVGIDTPEVGECGYGRAATVLARLVLNKQVTLGRSDEDRDGYGRLLRYVDVGAMDAGLRLIKGGLAIARYDSRDGYGFHPREPRYIAADKGAGNLKCAKPLTLMPPPPAGRNCAPGYSPCVPPGPPDLDCADVNGPIRVTGTDPHRLDADGDGWACES